MRSTGVVALLAALTLAGCSATEGGPSEEEAGALAAARVYVDAIADLDPAAADAMTDPDALDDIDGDYVDVRDALPNAVDPITDAWVTLASPTYEAHRGLTEYVVLVSYDVGELTGGGAIVVTLDEDGDPGEVADWTVTDPLVATAPTYADDTTVRVALLGGVELTYGSTSYRGVWGYPGGYRFEAAEPVEGVEPLWLPVGAPDAPPWNDSLPMLEKPED